MTGVDENGLGPRLGPLVATAATMRMQSYEAAELEAAGRSLGIADSKDTTAFGKMRRAESLVLAWCERTKGGASLSMDALLNRLVLGGVAELQSRCPEGGSFEQCWGLGIALPAFGGTLDEGEAMLDGLQRLGVEVSHVRSVVGCAGRLNQDFARGMSKLMIDLRYFEDLLRDARAASGESLDAWCGMVGGIRKYGARFAADLGEPMVLEERKGLSAYVLPEIGHVRFEVKADAKHLPVALASMFGKYVRELWMLRLNEFYGKQLPALRACSGYHDSVSKRFVTETEALRVKLGIVNTCFERNR